MRRLFTLIMLLLLGLLSACSGSTPGKAVENTMALIVVLVILAICVLVVIGIGVWQFYRHNKDKIGTTIDKVDELKKTVTDLKK
jgi:heme/copper-type cytochrome/quinol oxidase subunit 2